VPLSTDRWRAAPKVAYEFLRDDAVVLDLQSGNYYRLNSVAASAWRLLHKPARLDDLVDRLLEGYEVERETLIRDLAELLSQMEEYGLVVREAGAC
jgi:hypothetical protein